MVRIYFLNFFIDIATAILLFVVAIGVIEGTFCCQLINHCCNSRFFGWALDFFSFLLQEAKEEGNAHVDACDRDGFVAPSYYFDVFAIWISTTLWFRESTSNGYLVATCNAASRSVVVVVRLACHAMFVY